METLQSVIALMRPGCYMASIDLRDAYYSVPIDIEYQKYLKFYWNGCLYQFTCLPNGLSSGPRLFTKIVKPIYSMLRQLGYINASYIDDSYLQGDTTSECQNNVVQTKDLLSQAGFLVHPDKSVFVPTQRLEFLGFLLDSSLMQVMLTPHKVNKLKLSCLKVLKKPHLTVRELSQLIGSLVSSFPGVQYGPLHYRSLEALKTKVLKDCKGDFEAMLSLTPACIEDLQWWVDHIDTAYKPILYKNADVIMHSDASKAGWGAVINNTSTGGRWDKSETEQHINVLELRALFMGLQSFSDTVKNKHVQAYMDNSTAVAYINSMGGTRSPECNELAREIWQWCIVNNVWVSAAHIPGSTNVEADRESRQFNDNIEWMLNPKIFLEVTARFGSPNIDLFASRLNRQVPCYVSWKPDPNATFIDAFNVDWSKYFFYAFPPFSLIPRCLQKVEQLQAEGILLVPNWPTQPWFSKAMQLLTHVPIILPRERTILQLPWDLNLVHPLHNQMSLLACRISGNPIRCKEFLQQQPTLLLAPGDPAPVNYMKATLADGRHTVIRDKLIMFDLL